MEEFSVFISDDEGYIQEFVVEALSAEDAYERAGEGLGELVGSYVDTVGGLAWVEDENGNRIEL